jgi:hypothetical protein
MAPCSSVTVCKIGGWREKLIPIRHLVAPCGQHAIAAAAITAVARAFGSQAFGVWRNAHRLIRQRLTQTLMQTNEIDISMENVFGAELRLAAEEIQSLLIGCLAVAATIAVFAAVIALCAPAGDPFGLP